MEQDQFLALMPYISADLVDMLIRRRGITEEEALEKLYRSQLYAALEKEETSLFLSCSLSESITIQLGIPLTKSCG